MLPIFLKEMKIVIEERQHLQLELASDKQIKLELLRK
jgi:hypothetical protein